MEYIKFKNAQGEISLRYLREDVTKEEFDELFPYIPEDERNRVWKIAHDNPTIPKSNKDNKRKPNKLG